MSFILPQGLESLWVLWSICCWKIFGLEDSWLAFPARNQWVTSWPACSSFGLGSPGAILQSFQKGCVQKAGAQQQTTTNWCFPTSTRCVLCYSKSFFCGLVMNVKTSDSLFFEKESAEDPLESQAKNQTFAVQLEMLALSRKHLRDFASVGGKVRYLSVLPRLLNPCFHRSWLQRESQPIGSERPSMGLHQVHNTSFHWSQVDRRRFLKMREEECVSQPPWFPVQAVCMRCLEIKSNSKRGKLGYRAWSDGSSIVLNSWLGSLVRFLTQVWISWHGPSKERQSSKLSLAHFELDFGLI